MASLPPYLSDIQREIEGYGRAYGLDFWEVEFEILDYKRMQEVAAFGGFPVRYPHWRFGMEFEHLTKSHIYGFSKIYEMVINNNPAYAYLLEGNSLVDQKMVIAHVLGHVDFFKNNYFGSEDRFNAQLRVEMFNAFNHPRFGAPDANVNDSTFGKITSTVNSARQIQLALKFVF